MTLFSKHILALVMSTSLSFVYSSSSWASEASESIFMLKSTERSMAEVVTAVKTFAKHKGWIYLGDFKVKKGQVILVKFCVKAAGKKAWKAGLKVSAMLPCGNMGIYQKNGKTEISILNPDYMNTLYPNPNLKAAGELLLPQYHEMLEAITK